MLVGLAAQVDQQAEQAAQPQADRDHMEDLDRDIKERVAAGRGMAVGDVAHHRPGGAQAGHAQREPFPAAPQPDGHDREAGDEQWQGPGHDRAAERCLEDASRIDAGIAELEADHQQRPRRRDQPRDRQDAPHGCGRAMGHQRPEDGQPEQPDETQV